MSAESSSSPASPVPKNLPPLPGPDELRAMAQGLTREQLFALDEQLEALSDVVWELMQPPGELPAPKPPKAAAKKPGGISYRRGGVRCGKANCKCAEGDLHGPYWYAYATRNGKRRSVYLGKKKDVAKAKRLLGLSTSAGDPRQLSLLEES